MVVGQRISIWHCGIRNTGISLTGAAAEAMAVSQQKYVIQKTSESDARGWHRPVVKLSEARVPATCVNRFQKLAFFLLCRCEAPW